MMCTYIIVLLIVIVRSYNNICQTNGLPNVLSPLFVCSRLGSEVTSWPIGSKQPSPAAASALARATDLDVDTREPCHLPDQCRVAASPKASSCFHFLFLGPCRQRWTIGAMGNITAVLIGKLTIV